MFWLKKEPNISQILLKLWLIGNRTSCHPIPSVIILVIKQRGRPILLITRMIADRIGLHSVLLPILIVIEMNNFFFLTWLIFKLASKHFVLFLKAAIFFPLVSQLISL